MTQLVRDVERFSAVEELLHQALDDYGIPTRIITGKYNYVASMSEPQPGRLYVDEFRSNKLSLEGYPDPIATTGFAVLALVFHPHMRENFAMTCEGLGDWRGHATWLMHFRQRSGETRQSIGKDLLDGCAGIKAFTLVFDGLRPRITTFVSTSVSPAVPA